MFDICPSSIVLCRKETTATAEVLTEERPGAVGNEDWEQRSIDLQVKLSFSGRRLDGGASLVPCKKSKAAE